MPESKFLFAEVRASIQRVKGPLSHKNLIVERTQGVLTLTLSDPPTRNALGPEMVLALETELDRFDKDPGDRAAAANGPGPVLLLRSQRKAV